jgi:peptidoglycan hydrolase-like protein with peptidoglycan-binding domain
MGNLKKGSSGPLVYTVQEMLNDWQASRPKNANSGAKPLKLTGKFDNPTEDLVKEMQFFSSLTPNGIVDDITSTMLTGSPLDFETNGRPLAVKQDHKFYRCWAASIQGWTSARTDIKTMMQEDAFAKFSVVKGALGPKDSLTTRGWTAVVKHFKLGYKAYGGSNGAPISALTIDGFYARMKKSGHVMVAYNYKNSPYAHTVVVFGVNVVPDKKATNPVDCYNLHVMDPWLDRRLVEPLNNILAGGVVLVLWR